MIRPRDPDNLPEYFDSISFKDKYTNPLGPIRRFPALAEQPGNVSGVQEERVEFPIESQAFTGP